MGKTLIGIIAAAYCAFLSTAAAATELRVLEWEGYISTFKSEFEAYAKAKGKAVTLTFPKAPIASADDIFTALRNGDVDVVTPTHNYYKGENAKLMQLLEPLDVSRIGGYDSLYPPLRQSSALRDEAGKVYGVPLLGGSYALAYNTSKVQSAPDWRDLLTPAAKGRFTVTSDQYEANVYQMALLAGVKPADIYDYDRYTETQRRQVAENLKLLVGNAAGFWGGMPYPKDMVGLDYVTDYWFGVAAANKAGQSWRIAKTATPSTVWLDTIALARSASKDASKLDAAYLLLTFMTSAETQARVHQEFGSVVVSAAARSLLPPDKAAQLPGEDFFVEQFFWQPLTPRTRNAFKLMWDAALKDAGKR